MGRGTKCRATPKGGPERKRRVRWKAPNNPSVAAPGKPFCAFARDAPAPASLRSSPDIHVRSFAGVRLTLQRAESR
jgi:hypothetical protein